MNKQIMVALVAAFVMVVASTAIATNESDSSDATSPCGHFTIFVYDGSDWTHENNVCGYDAAIALQNSELWSADDDVMGERTVTEWGYTNINSGYGDITTFRGQTETSVNTWHTIAYNSTTETWYAGQDNIGHYRPYSDYSTTSAWQTANLAFYFGAELTGTDLTAFINTLVSYTETDDNGVTLSSIVTVDNSSDFEVTFNLKVSYSGAIIDIETGTVVTLPDGITTKTLLASDLTQTNGTTVIGITIVGYGSDAYLALIDAIGSDNLDGENTIPFNSWTPYSYIYYLFGLTSVEISIGADNIQYTDDDEWVWYKTSTVIGGVTAGAGFNLGWYSPLSCAPETCDSFVLEYAFGHLGDM